LAWQLSVLATAGILILQPYLDFYTKNWRFKVYGEILAYSLVSQIMVFPLLIYHFHTWSLLSLISNFWFLPLLPILTIIGILSLFPLPIWQGFVLIMSQKIWNIVLTFLAYLATLPGISWELYWSNLFYLLYWGGIIYFGFYLIKNTHAKLEKN